MQNIEAKYFLNLLQITACLLENDEDSLYKIVTYKYGQTNGIDGDRMIIGIMNAASFLHDVYKSRKLIDDDLILQLKINPLINLLNIDIEKFQNREIPKMKFSAVPEGTKISNSYPYFQFETSYFYMALVCLAMDRIVEFQTHILKQCESYQKIIAQYGIVTPLFFNDGSHKNYSTTFSAYESRARELGGIKRFYDEDLFKRSEKYAKQKAENLWQIKSSDLIEYINSEQNKNLMQNYLGDEISNVLIEDGIYYLKENQFLNFNLTGLALDGTYKNEFQIDSSNDSLITPKISFNSEDFIIDSKYQNIYPLKRLSTSAIYGQKGRLTSKLIEGKKTFRANRNRIPAISCDTLEQLNEIILTLKKEHPDKSIFYRGQTSHHNLKRSSLTNSLLYGDIEVDEISLPTSASRNLYDFDGFAAALQLQIQGIIYSECDIKQFKDFHNTWPLWGNFSPFEDPQLEDIHEKFKKLFYSYEWDLMTMAVGQHYGIPTHGLDVTSDLDVAIWFATNKYESDTENGKKICWHSRMIRNEENDFTKYPVIYIIGTNSNLKMDLDQIEYIGLKAERPIRQKAYLHYGGYGLHSNICAEDVLAVIFLSDKFKYESKYTYEYLFPSIEEDPFYKKILELKEKALDVGLVEGYEKIAEYKFTCA